MIDWTLTTSCVLKLTPTGSLPPLHTFSQLAESEAQPQNDLTFEVVTAGRPYPATWSTTDMSGDIQL